MPGQPGAPPHILLVPVQLLAQPEVRHRGVRIAAGLQRSNGGERRRRKGRIWPDSAWGLPPTCERARSVQSGQASRQQVIVERIFHPRAPNAPSAEPCPCCGRLLLPRLAHRRPQAIRKLHTARHCGQRPNRVGGQAGARCGSGTARLTAPAAVRAADHHVSAGGRTPPVAGWCRPPAAAAVLAPAACSRLMAPPCCPLAAAGTATSCKRG